jgi:hypothetical protein
MCHTGSAESFFAALQTISFAVGAGYYVNDDAASVFTTRRACTMVLAKRAAFTFDETCCSKSMMTPALS